MDYTAYRHAVESLSLALRKHGLQPQEKIAILSGTRREWNVTDLAAQCARGVVVPVYPSYLPDEVAFIVKHSESCMIAVEDEAQLSKVLRVYDELPRQKLLISFSPIGGSLREHLAARSGPVLRTFAELLEEGAAELALHPSDLRGDNRNQPPADLSTIIYTSGTDGRAQGRGHHAVRVVAELAERARGPSGSIWTRRTRS